MKNPIIGVIENMKMKGSSFIKERVESKGIAFWGEIPFDNRLEESIGDVNKLLQTVFARKIEEIISKNLKL